MKFFTTNAILVVAVIVKLFFNDVIVQPEGIGTDAVTLGYLASFTLFFGGIYWVYKMRNIKPFDVLWGIIISFFALLFIWLGAGYAKKSVKNWWNKD